MSGGGLIVLEAVLESGPPYMGGGSSEQSSSVDGGRLRGLSVLATEGKGGILNAAMKVVARSRYVFSVSSVRSRPGSGVRGRRHLLPLMGSQVGSSVKVSCVVDAVGRCSSSRPGRWPHGSLAPGRRGPLTHGRSLSRMWAIVEVGD